MGFWNKLGKIALQAAPYVAAPFTGGASLMATGATQKLGQKWAAHDAKKAAEKGLAPSKFDKYLGMASGVAGAASSLSGGFGGALGGAGKVGAGVGKGANLSSIASASTKAGGTSGWQKALGMAADYGKSKLGNTGGGNQQGGGWEQMLQQVMASRNPGGEYGTPSFNPNSPQMPESPIGPSANFEQQQGGLGRTAQGPVMPRGGYDYDNNPMHQLNQNMPNLSQSIFQGRQDAMRDRDRYMSPPISESGGPVYEELPQEPAPYGDALTPPQGGARKRSPGAFSW